MGPWGGYNRKREPRAYVGLVPSAAQGEALHHSDAKQVIAVCARSSRMNQPQPDSEPRAKAETEGPPPSPWAAGNPRDAAVPAQVHPSTGSDGATQTGIKTMPRLDSGSIFSVPHSGPPKATTGQE